MIAAGLALLLCFAFTAGAKAAGVASSPWPMFQHDPQHTGRSNETAPANLAEKWRVRLDGVPGSPAIGPDGTIYVGTGNIGLDKSGSLFAINPDGSVRWRYQFGTDPETGCGLVSGFTTPAIDADGTIYIHIESSQPCIAGPSRLLAINPNGTVKWAYPVNGGAGVFIADNLSSPAIAPDGTIVFASADTGLYAINPDGTTRWAVSPSATSIDSSPAIAPDGTIYVSVGDLFAYDPNGNLKWSAPVSGALPDDRSPSIGANGTIYACGEFPDVCRALNPAGGEIWSVPIAVGEATTPATAGDGTVYFAGKQSFGIVAVSPGGSVRWRADLDNSLPGSVAVSANGEIYSRGEGGGFLGQLSGMFVLNPTGSSSAKTLVSGQSIEQDGELSPAIGSGGTVYVPEPDFNALDYNPANQFLAAFAKAPPCGGKQVTIVGSPSPETIKGTDRADVIAGLGGNDKLSGLAGNDVICGGAGNDTLKGGKGNDTLYGEAGKDTLRGGPGRDKLKGGPGKDKQVQ